MHRAYKMVKDAVRQYPLPLVKLDEPKLIEFANSFMPRSVGIEIECSIKDKYENIIDEEYNDIPGVLEVNISSHEHRFRVVEGIDGMAALYHICDHLKETSLLNPLSGIHYHIDFTDMFNKLNVDTNNYQRCRQYEWMLKGLRNWGYKGTYNTWVVDTGKEAIRLHGRCQTIEFRLGEMTFDYDVMMKRIITCQRIVEKLRASLLSPNRTKVYL